LKKQLLSEEIQKRVLGALWSTWESIGCDVMNLEGIGDSIPQKEVIELVLDADYAEMYGGDKEAMKEFRKLSYDNQKKIAKLRFTYKRYS
jgi:hypothetical protein